MSGVAGVETTFSSWDSCMTEAYWYVGHIPHTTEGGRTRLD